MVGLCPVSGYLLPTLVTYIVSYPKALVIMDECGSFFLVEKPILQGGVGYHGWKWILFKALVIMDESKSLEVQGSFFCFGTLLHDFSFSLSFFELCEVPFVSP